MDPQARKIDVLLVEDNPGDILLTRRALEKNKLVTQLAVARDGEEAMQYLRKEDEFTHVSTPDIILLDLNLPRLDGREVLDEIKKDPNLRHIPVVVLTSSEAESDINQSYNLLANCYVVKPIEGEKFMEVVQHIHRFWHDTVVLPFPKCKQ